MRLTRRQLRQLVENYLQEQEEEGAPPVEDEGEEVPAEEDTGEPPAEEETGAPPIEDEGEESPPEDTAEDSGETEGDATESDAPADDGLPENYKPFEIIVDDVKHKVKFVKDKNANVLKLMIDDVEIKNPVKQDFVTMAGLGLQGKMSDEDKAALENVVKKTDISFAKFDDVPKIIQDKMNAERKGFSVADIRNIIAKSKK